MRERSLWIVLVGIWGLTGHAEIKVEMVEYRHGDAVLEGSIAYDAGLKGKRPGVLVVHEWKGYGPYARGRAEQLAKLGYVAFAMDMYGKGVRAESHEDAAKLSGIYRGDRKLMRARAEAALQVMQKHPLVEGGKIAAIGYCFGGTTVLEMARAGMPLAGVASFHGALTTPLPAARGAIKAKVAVFHGADDQGTNPGVADFQEEMRKAGADWQMTSYGGAVHSFTVKEAGDDPSKGMAYHPLADQRSWEALKRFLAEAFGR